MNSLLCSDGAIGSGLFLLPRYAVSSYRSEAALLIESFQSSLYRESSDSPRRAAYLIQNPDRHGPPDQIECRLQVWAPEKPTSGTDQHRSRPTTIGHALPTLKLYCRIFASVTPSTVLSRFRAVPPPQPLRSGP